MATFSWYKNRWKHEIDELLGDVTSYALRYNNQSSSLKKASRIIAREWRNQKD